VNLGAERAKTTYLLHLPGIAGHMRIDDMLTSGLMLGGIDAQVEIDDWPGDTRGLAALGAIERNRQQARRIAEKLALSIKNNPTRSFILTGHSAGSGLAVWTLENLPDDVQIDTLVLLAPALSPEYDLSKALKRVRGKAYVLVSEGDVVLGAGTRNFGTVDRVNTDSAGRVGFQMPENADREQYKKLIPVNYDPQWVRFGNMGDHVGPMSRAFAKSILAPLLLTGELPKLPPTSQPATRAAG
jgi:alpha-beta hydrolase superfamily lysophospholipase